MGEYKTAAHVLVSQLAEEAEKLVYRVTEQGPLVGKESLSQFKKKQRQITLVAEDLRSIVNDAVHFTSANDFVAKQFSNYVRYNQDFLIDLLERQLRIDETDLCGVLLVSAKQKREEERREKEDDDLDSEDRRPKTKTINYYT